MSQECCVCGEALDPENVSRCNLCGGYFHMAWATDAQVKECGHYWINDQSCSLAFICNNCEKDLPDKPDKVD